MIINRDAFIAYVTSLAAKGFDECLKQNDAVAFVAESETEVASMAADIFEGLAEGIREAVAQGNVN